MGTPDFARTHLEALVCARDDEVLVVTRPDRPAGRGRRLRPSSVKLAAEALGLDLMQPESAGDPEFVAKLGAFAPDFLVVVAYRVLPEEVLAIPRVCAINVHPSLLPKYRGAAPIPRALMNGETRTGVTIIRLAPEVDAGDIVARRVTTVGADETAGELSERLARLGSELLLEVLDRFESGVVLFRKQAHSLATSAPRITRADALIDWSADARTVANLVRALNPKPAAYSYLFAGAGGPTRLGILRGQPIDVPHSTPAGTVLEAKKTIRIACGNGAFEATEVIPAGSRKMSAKSYLVGNAVQPGDVFRPTDEP